MQEHELTAWLGGTPVTAEQRASLHRASDMAAVRYGHDRDDDREQAFSGAAQVILGDATLGGILAEWTRARRTERDAMAVLTGALIAASEDESEVDLARTTGMSRMTVRRALGK